MQPSTTDRAAPSADPETAVPAARAEPAEPGIAAIVLGEVRTCLLQNREPLSTPATEELMRLTPGAPVSRVERPVRRVVSTDQVLGVDCGLSLARTGRGRAIGTVLSHAVVTGGRVLQGAAHVSLTPAPRAQRREWPYYLRQPGCAEVIGAPRPDAVIDGFLADSAPSAGLDLASICGRVLEQVQAAALLDHITPVRTRTSVLRWSAHLRPGHEGRLTMDIVKSDAANEHVIRFQGGPADLALVERFCEEFARHEWLLSTLQDAILPRAERALARDHAYLDLLAFTLDQLVPLWMAPTYHSTPMAELWLALEDRTHYSQLFERQAVRARTLIARRLRGSSSP